MIGLIAATRRGGRLAGHLAGAWPDARLYTGRPAEALARAFPECRGLVMFMAVGAALRLVAPLLKDKSRDPGIVGVDDAARFAVALAGGHAGGANRLAVRVGETLGAEPVITTASDVLGYPDLESLGADIGFRLEEGGDLAAVGSAIVSGERVTLVSDLNWPLPPVPPNVVRGESPEAPSLVVSDRTGPVPRPAVVYRPPSLVLGIGC
ncbi:MAG: cobalamin biosynthesis central domain-containing protein, partial [Acidimicrobiales bacterium]